jgi:hypothetical protein
MDVVLGDCANVLNFDFFSPQQLAKIEPFYPDIGATDVLLVGEGDNVVMGGLAGDIIGDYILPEEPHVGQRIAFLDQAHYSMVKTNTFNGVPLPSIWLWNSESDTLRCVKSFDWTKFRDRLS